VQFTLFSILLFGQLFVIRTQRSFGERGLISKDHLPKLGVVITASLIIGAFFLSSLWASAFALSVLLFYRVSLHFLERRQCELFRALVPILIDAWILNLRLGIAESHARETALSRMDSGFAKLVRTSLHSPNLLTDASVFEPLFIKELQNIAQTPHFALERLECLRANLKRTSDFRRKSGQATRQTRIQSLTMLILLLALSLVAIKRYGWSQVGDLVGLAVILASVGLAAIQLVARKTKWNT
jgi:hypothetical protein